MYQFINKWVLNLHLQSQAYNHLASSSYMVRSTIQGLLRPNIQESSIFAFRKLRHFGQPNEDPSMLLLGLKKTDSYDHSILDMHCIPVWVVSRFRYPSIPKSEFVCYLNPYNLIQIVICNWKTYEVSILLNLLLTTFVIILLQCIISELSIIHSLT